MKAYSLDLRERVVAALVEGASVAQVALRFGVSHDTVQRYGKLHEQGQGLSPRPRVGRAPRVAPHEDEALVAMVRENPNRTIEQNSAAWQERTGVELPRSTMHDHLQRVGIERTAQAGARFKKKSDRFRAMPEKTGGISQRD